MRKVLIVVFFLILGTLAFAQDAQPNFNPSSNPAVQVGPTITFSISWPQAIPPFYSVAVTSSGSTAYQSTPQSDKAGDPYELKFTMSEQNRSKLFELAKATNYFSGDYDYKKGRLAFTGTKTLVFKDGDKQSQTSYNWSTNLQIQEITKIFQAISETVERGRTLADKYRFDKLGVDAELRGMEDAAKNGQLEELQAIQPILTKVAKDSNMMNITRRRAEFLLSKIPPDASAKAGQP